MTPTVCCHVALDGKTLVADVTGVGAFPCVHTLVCVQTTLLCKTFQTQITLKRAFTCMRSHVHLEVGFAAEARLARCALKWLAA